MRRKKYRKTVENIARLERWHRIFNEWAVSADNYPYALEMARQGLTYASYIIDQYYLPQVKEMLNQRNLLTSALLHNLTDA